MPNDTLIRACGVCQAAEGLKRCAGCQSRWYCGREHQVQDWPYHRNTCDGRTTRSGGTSASSRNNSSVSNARPSSVSWMRGMSTANSYEYFVDMYRLRVDDDMVWGGGQLNGLYDQPTSPEKIIKHFLLFCKLAALKNQVPRSWDWSVCLTKAKELIPFAFEKSDFTDKWNSPMSAIAVRMLASTITGIDIQHGGAGPPSPAYDRIEGEIEEASDSGLWTETTKALFKEVGGQDVWKRLHDQLGAIPHINTEM